MGGGLMQLVAYGAQDVYLTGNPNITFFKVVYRRHTNFSTEVIEHSFTGNFGQRSSVTISRNGDLITKMYLKVTLPQVVARSAADTNTKFAWSRRVGYALLKNVELEIGGSKIDKQYGNWMNIWYELSSTKEHDSSHAQMVGDTPEVTQLESYNSSDSVKIIKREQTLFVPLYFWFNRNNGLALPLIA